MARETGMDRELLVWEENEILAEKLVYTGVCVSVEDGRWA